MVFHRGSVAMQLINFHDVEFGQPANFPGRWCVPALNWHMHRGIVLGTLWALLT